MQEDNKQNLKSNFSEGVIESLVAFANTKGGKVLIGIDNKGNPVNHFIIGSESLQTWVNEIKNKTQPSIIPDAEVIQIQEKNIASMSIQEFPVKPVAFRGCAYPKLFERRQWAKQHTSE